MMEGELAPVPNDLPSVEREIGEIQSLMTTNRRAYNADEGKQARLRQLYDVRSRSTMLAETDDGMDDREPYSPAEFGKEFPGGDYGRYMDLYRAEGDIMTAMPAGERGAFESGLLQLPQGALTAMVGELINRSTCASVRASDDIVAQFSREPGGSLVREWGSSANEMLGRVRARVWRAMDAMETDAEAEAFAYWLVGLSEGAARAVYRKLAA